MGTPARFYRMRILATASVLMIVAACAPVAPVAPPAFQAPASEGLRFTVEPSLAAPGASVMLILANGTPHELGYNLCGSALEHLQGVQWRTVPQEVVCTRELRIAAPGQVVRYQTRLPTTLAAGEYRFRTGVESPLNRRIPGLEPIVSEPFVVRR